MAIGGVVIDVSEFIHLHIGGPHIVRNYVGTDATAAYRKVLHHVNAEIDSQLSMYQIGHLRRLQFGARFQLSGRDPVRRPAHAGATHRRFLRPAAGHPVFRRRTRRAVDPAGATLLAATRTALAAVSAYYQRLAVQTRGHGLTGDGAVEEAIPADRGLPGHGGPLLLPD